MSPGLVAAILFGTFALLVIIRIPVAFALGLACVPVFFISDRLSPTLLFDQMFVSYNSFILLAVPFFLLAANLMNSAGITQRLIDLSRALVGHLPGGLGHVNSVASIISILNSSRISSTAISAIFSIVSDSYIEIFHFEIKCSHLFIPFLMRLVLTVM